MKNVLVVLWMCGVWAACEQAKPPVELSGSWKTYQVRYGKKDISKSSDVTQNNGIWFDEQGNYRRFGHPAQRDTGRYEFEGDWLILTSQQDSLANRMAATRRQDTLYLMIPGNDTIRMSLYKMVD